MMSRLADHSEQLRIRYGIYFRGLEDSLESSKVPHYEGFYVLC